MEKKGLAWHALRRFFHSLPVGAHGKEILKNAIYSRFPSIFGGLMSYQLWDNRRKVMNRISGPDIMFSLGEIAGSGMVETGASGFKLPTSPQPLVSIIIPVYGKINYTLQCLRSIMKNPPQAPFEIIVVDDLSPDNTREVLASAAGLRVISNETNQGFIRSCNSGAAAARGEYLLFLNNDTVICPGWLDELLRTFTDFPGTGLAGSKLVYPDRRLQEAGGIIWRDGSAWNFGRGQDYAHPKFNYAREADYISGASIMIPKALFEEFGGFDELYLPAYGEDADIALKVRRRGLKVIYQPLSVVIHYEGITSGSDIKVGVKSYQVENARKLYERWKGLLASNQPPGENPDAAKDRGVRYRALVLDHCTPTPDQDSGSITSFNFMLLLRQAGFQVTFIPEDNFLYMPGYTGDLQRAGIEALYAPYCASVKQHLKESGGRYDLILIFRPVVADRHLKNVRKFCKSAKIIYHTSDLHFLRMSREADLTGDAQTRRDAGKMKKHELSVMRAADVVVVHSSTEKDILSTELPDTKVSVFQWAIPIRGSTANFDERADIVFLGGYQHSPNVDAVLYFAAEIFPFLRKRIPGVQFYAVGSNPTKELLDLTGEDIFVTGFVDDLAPLLDRMRVAVAPLRYGAGNKGKICTTLSLGLPCVGTTIAVEGMELREGGEILVADTPEAFADAVARLYQDKDLWDTISSRGVEFARHMYGPESAQAVVRDILRGLGFEPRSDAVPVIISPTGGRYGTGRTVKKQPVTLTPAAVCRSMEDILEYRRSESFHMSVKAENALIASHQEEMAYSIPGYCIPCERETLFLVDMLAGGAKTERGWVPNFRERLECPGCSLKNRLRLVAALMKQQIAGFGNAGVMVYMMEQVTPLYEWAVYAFPNHGIIGSEYFEGAPSGQVVKGVRNENAEAMSFGDASLNLIVSNDVLEHVPNPALALSECVRALRPGGQLLMTIPFYADAGKNVTRARLDAKGVHHFLPPVYHGNPVSVDGSLVFTDFGWDILPMMRSAGFADAWAEVYNAPEFGHLGENLLVFRGSIS